MAVLDAARQSGTEARALAPALTMEEQRAFEASVSPRRA